jgi:uncharacterized protein YggU (UPF0235/DUF167 family)
MLGPAVRWMVGTGSTGTSRVLISCRVKPGVSAAREGISAVTEDSVEMCVTNHARDGLANKSVRGVIAKALRMPISDITLVRGTQSRDKVVGVNIRTKGTPEEKVRFVRSVLLGNVTR